MEKYQGLWFDYKEARASVPKERYTCFSFSVGAAFAFVRMQKPDRVDVYGMDMVGDQDWDGGYRGIGGRNPSRWEKERPKIAWIFKVLKDDGIRVYRHMRAGDG